MDVKFLTVGDTMISLEFGDDISIETNLKVHAFNRVLTQDPIHGVWGTTPAYRSLAISYKPEVIGYRALIDECQKRLASMTGTSGVGISNTVLEIPTFYGGDFGDDLEEVAAFHNVTPDKIVEMHTAHENIIYMMGFAPGQAYMGAPNGLKIPRRKEPRIKVEIGSVVIWENQTIITPITNATGWQIIGRTPVRILNIKKTNPFLLQFGLWIKFKSVTMDEFLAVQEQVEADAYRCRTYERGA